ncbi:MAG: hypothetical protein EGR87_01295 [Sutterella wadsworthensis]|nr:hypothetical protein [Sutterella wadsworthensis]
MKSSFLQGNQCVLFNLDKLRVSSLWLGSRSFFIIRHIVINNVSFMILNIDIYYFCYMKYVSAL